METDIPLGQWLKRRRKELDLTQEDLAERIGCASETIRKIEAGKRRPSRQVVELLAECLGVAPDERPAFMQLARTPHASRFAQLPTAAGHAPEYMASRSARTNLPIQLTPFIGREREVEAVRALLWSTDVRLLTLTGPGGVGKTRLALQVAAELQNDYADEVFFIGLAPTTDPALVAPTVAQTLGVKEVTSQLLVESLKSYLADRQMLLLLDNFEQVVMAAPLVAELLSSAPRLKVLVTSRAALHVYGEHEFLVPPLALPDVRHLPPLETLAQYEAVALFSQRAQAVKPDFALTRDNALKVVEICHRLDGLPLAIELAAARIKVMPAHTILARLEHRLPLLTGGGRDLPARQQTLRSAIEWSYDLLRPNEQKLFRRLGVFVGGCTLEAAEDVCDRSQDLGIDVLDGIASLTDKSLLWEEEQADGEPRFYMLETIREYALERLSESEEAEAMRRNHAGFFLTLAEEAEPELQGADQGVWLSILEREHDNLRTAMRWAVSSGEVEMGSRLAGALSQFWAVRGYFREGREWLVGGLFSAEARAEAAGSSLSRVATLAKAKALSGAANLAYYLQDDETSARTFAEKSLAMYRKLGDKQGIADSLIILARMADNQGDYTTARALAEESLAISRELGNKHGIALSLNNLGRVAYYQGDYASARPLHEESLAIRRELGHKRGVGQSLYNLGLVARHQGDNTSAHSLYKESLVISRELGDKYGIVQSTASLGNVALDQGDYALARSLYEEGLTISRELGDKYCIADLLMGLGYVARNQGDYASARSLSRESLTMFRELGEEEGIANSLDNLGRVAYYEGDYVSARSLHEESLGIRRKLGDKSGIALSLNHLGRVAHDEGDYVAAHSLFEESLAISRGLGARRQIAECLESLARLAGSQGTQGAIEYAACLWGAADILREASATPLAPADRVEYERSIVAVRARLDEVIWIKAWGEGRTMPMEQAIKYALEEI